MCIFGVVKWAPIIIHVSYSLGFFFIGFSDMCNIIYAVLFIGLEESWSELITSKSWISLDLFSDLQKGKGKPRQLDLERALTARDRVGVQDLVLLDAHNSETAVLDNLKKRFSEDLIYVSLGWPENRVHSESRLFLSPRSLTVTTDHELGKVGCSRSLRYHGLS